jgi:hypothetical protein
VAAATDLAGFLEVAHRRLQLFAKQRVSELLDAAFASLVLAEQLADHIAADR